MKFLLPLLILTTALSAAEPTVIKLWPAGAPGTVAVKPPAPDAKPNPSVITNITDPTLTVYQPEKPCGTVVIVAPGGGFRFLSIKHEGTQVCEWLNTLGVTAVLLTYRTPTNEETNAYEKPVADAQQAIRILKERAAEWKIQRIGLLGFSAGGNLAGHLCLDRLADAQPAPRPDFMVFIYGGGFLDREDKTKFRPGFSVPADAPPAFFLVAHDDRTNPVEAAMLYLEYKKLNLSAELHIFAKGGHGFGMRKDGHPINDWPQRTGEWMKSQGYLGQ